MPAALAVVSAGPTGELASLDIEGPGAGKLTVSGGNASRVFEIDAGTVTIANTASDSGGTVVLWFEPLMRTRQRADSHDGGETS